MKFFSTKIVWLSIIILFIVVLSEVQSTRESKAIIPIEELIGFPQTYMGSKFEESPLGESVESYIQSDFTINGFYGIKEKNQIKIFSSSNYKSPSIGSQLEIFEHTPDVCWVGSGWERLFEEDHQKQIEVGKESILFERRVYQFGDTRELCYFAFLLGGKSLSAQDETLISSAADFDKKRSFVSGLRCFHQKILNTLVKNFADFKQSYQSAQFIRVSVKIDQTVESSEKSILSFLEKCDYGLFESTTENRK